MQAQSDYGKLFCMPKISFSCKSNQCVILLGVWTLFNKVRKRRSHTDIYHDDSVTCDSFIHIDNGTIHYSCTGLKVLPCTCIDPPKTTINPCCVSDLICVCCGVTTRGLWFNYCINLNKSTAMYSTKCQDSTVWSCASSSPAITIKTLLETDERFQSKETQECFYFEKGTGSVADIFDTFNRWTLKLWGKSILLWTVAWTL